MKTPSNDELFEFLRKLSSNPRAIMVIAACVFFLDAAFLLRGQLSQAGRLFSEARTLKNEYKSDMLDVKFAATYKTRLETLKTEETARTKQIPAEENIAVLLEAVSKFADVSSVKLNRIKPIPDAQSMANAVAVSIAGRGEEKIFREKVALTARGGFHQLGRFIAFLENAANFYDINSLEIRTDDQDYAYHIITMVVEVVVSKG